MNWFAHLSWSHAAMLVLALCVVAGMCLMWALAPEETDLESESDPWPVRDYSSEYGDKVVWLRDRFLLAHPINRPR